MIDCECGATIAPALVVRDDVGDQHRCPECRRFWECCPACYAWFLPFARWNHQSGCPSCGLARDVKTALRLPNQHPRGRTLRELRDDAAVPQFVPVDGCEPGPEIGYIEDGEVTV